MGAEHWNKYPIPLVLAAIECSCGVKSAICKRIGDQANGGKPCSRHTLDRYIEQFPEVRRAIKEEEENLLDLAEATLWRKIKNDDWKATRFALETKGASRGYGRQSKISLDTPPPSITLPPSLALSLGEQFAGEGTEETDEFIEGKEGNEDDSHDESQV